MTNWLRVNGLWTLLNFAAVAILVILLLQENPEIRFGRIHEPLFEHSGRWAIRFLLLCLAMTPLNALLGWRWVVRLRKPAGLWAFGFGVLHLAAYARNRADLLLWLYSAPYFVFLGMAGLVILLLLALTSNTRAMRALGKNWKRLHRWVYAAGVLIALHALIAASSTKRGYARDGGAAVEFKIYLIVLLILLALRVTWIRRAVQHFTHRIGRTPRPKSPAIQAE